MRSDMHEVVIERPRWGSWMGYPRKTLANRWSRGGVVDGPKCEGMGALHRQKSLSDNLAPLVRFLRSRVGRPWSRVRSEIAEHLRATSTLQRHVLDHLDDFVIRSTWRDEAGVTWGAGRWGRPCPLTPQRRRRPQFFVHPKTGALAMVPVARSKKKTVIDPLVRDLSPTRQLRRVEGIWYEVELAPLPDPRGAVTAAWDVIAKREVTPTSRYLAGPLEGASAVWRSGRYARSTRQLSKKEIRQLVG